jgi:hypothetical protein
MAGNRSARHAGLHTVTIYADMDAFNSMISELEGDVERAIRPAAQAAAEVLYQAVRVNVAALGTKTGNLYGSIYQAYSPEKSSQQRAEYHVSWRTSGAGIRAPHGHLIEWGHWKRYKSYIGKDGNWYTNNKAPLPEPVRVAGKAFVRRASAQFDDAMKAAEKRFFEELKL